MWLENLYHKKHNPQGVKFNRLNTKNFSNILIQLDWMEEKGFTDPKNSGILLLQISHIARLYQQQIKRQIKKIGSDDDDWWHEDENESKLQEVEEDIYLLVSDLSDLGSELISSSGNYAKEYLHDFVTRFTTDYDEEFIYPDFIKTLTIVLNRLRGFAYYWGDQGHVQSPHRENVKFGDPVRVFNSKFLQPGQQYIDGTTASSDENRRYTIVRYPNGQTEQLTGHTYYDHQRLTWNRILQRWEFR